MRKAATKGLVDSAKMERILLRDHGADGAEAEAGASVALAAPRVPTTPTAPQGMTTRAAPTASVAPEVPVAPIGQAATASPAASVSLGALGTVAAAPTPVAPGSVNPETLAALATLATQFSPEALAALISSKTPTQPVSVHPVDPVAAASLSAQATSKMTPAGRDSTRQPTRLATQPVAQPPHMDAVAPVTSATPPEPTVLVPQVRPKAPPAKVFAETTLKSPEPPKDLTPLELLQVAQQLASPMKIKLVGTQLGVPVYVVEAALNENSKLADAAHAVLSKWRDNVGNACDARQQLRQALLNRGLESVVTSVLGGGVPNPVAPQTGGAGPGRPAGETAPPAVANAWPAASAIPPQVESASQITAIRSSNFKHHFKNHYN